MQVTSPKGISYYSSPSTKPATAEGFDPSGAATAADGTTAAGNQNPAEGHRAEYKYATRWLSHVLNMAGPRTFDSDTVLAPPGMALALRSPFGAATNPAQPVTYQAGNISLTAEGRAQTIVGELGNGVELALSEAIDALVVASPGRKENPKALVESYFHKLDADGSGSLSKTELTDLIDYYDQMARKDSPERIVLPGNQG